jgi:hypothetical protein
MRRSLERDPWITSPKRELTSRHGSVLIFAEVLPKTLAIARTDRTALILAFPVRVMVALLAPIVSTVQFIVWGAEYHSSQAWVEAHAAPIKSTDVSTFTAAGWYANVLTPADMNGAIRGQVTIAPTLTQLQTSMFTPICANPRCT